MSYNYLPLDENPLHFSQVKNLLQHQQWVSITFKAHERIEQCRRFLDDLSAQSNALHYGINTGFGYLQNVAIDASQTQQLQYNLLLSHACGMGDEVPQPIVQLMMMLKIKSLSYGFSGVQVSTVKRLMEMYNASMWPVIYTQGSLGASGDLAPLSHLSLPLIGEGEVVFEGKKMSSATALAKIGWQPVTLASKEGLALINGTQFMQAYGLYCLIKMEHLLAMANLVAALSVDAFGALVSPFHAAIHAIRPHAGQQWCAAELRNILQHSPIASATKTQVQDPYSFRCIPQVHGASYDVWQQALKVFTIEMNSVTDNPNIFPETEEILSGGNFHGQPLALQLDFLAIALSELANISERRIYQLISGSRGLPPFLTPDAGVNSGYMIPQYTAAGIVSENKQLCTPASVDSISSSNNQEDHVSMGANAATKCLRVVQNVERVLAIELLTAAQALEFRRPAASSPHVEALVAALRAKVPARTKDVYLHADMMAAWEVLTQYKN